MKKISRRSFLMATGVIAASAALSACGGSSASTSSAGSTAASTAASGTAAQGGGDLVIYSPNSEGLLNATIPLFEEKYGVNVELIQAGTGELVKRIQSEKNDPYADVLFGGSWSLMYTNEDLWEPVRFRQRCKRHRRLQEQVRLHHRQRAGRQRPHRQHRPYR